MKSRKSKILLATVVLLAGIGAGSFIALHGRTVTSSQQITKHTILVGSNRYVNACQALPYNQYQTVYGKAPTNGSAAEQQYADSLPAGTKVAESVCNGVIDLSADQHLRVATDVTQYDSAAAASAKYELDVADSEPVTGLKDTAYNPDNYTSYSLIRNTIVSLTVDDSDATTPLSDSDYQAMLGRALPILTKNINDMNLSQIPYPIAQGQPKIGQSTYFNPCDYITNATFKSIFNTASDQSNVTLDFQYNGAQAAATTKTTVEGLTDASCDRRNQNYQQNVDASRQDVLTGKLTQAQYNAKHAEYLKGSYQALQVDVKFFDSPSQALSQAKELASVHADAVNVKTVASPKVGDYSVIQSGDQQQADANTDMIIASKSYVIQLTLTYNKNGQYGQFARYPSKDQYQAAAKRILSDLPLR